MDKIFFGLDIGTASVGFAVTDENYKLKKLKGKDAWGVRLFDPANTAVERRVFRTTRRRSMRRKNRIALLQEIFAEEISKVDQGFFQRMNDSFYVQNDKAVNQPYSLFSGKEFNDKHYNRQFPTIYHLRKALIEQGSSDARLLYLAIHHIIKYRGHFLFEGQDFSSALKIDSLILGLNEELQFFELSGFGMSELDSLSNIVLDSKLKLTAKKKQFEKILNPTTKQEIEMISVMVGGSSTLNKIFATQDFSESEVKSIKFSDNGFEDNTMPKLTTILDEQHLAVIEKLKAIYDWTVLFSILQGNQYISISMCGRYEKHKKDLAILKKFVKENCKSKYGEIFRKDKLYSAYVASVKVGCEKVSIKKISVKEDFYKELKKVLAQESGSIIDKTTYEYILSEMENGTFLPKQVVKDNSVIPYQVNKMELDQILENASKHLAFLNEKHDGITVKEKISLLLTFKIPYYVGPLNNHHKEKFAWVERLSTGRVTPWNFDDKIDKDKSAEKFITRMTNKCSYLIGEDVLPKTSIIYQKFTVLNEINNIKINGEAITVELKQDIFNELYLLNKKVTVKKVKLFLIEKGLFNKNDKIEITGVDVEGELKSSMSSYVTFTDIFKELTTENIIIAENIIKWSTLFEDKKVLKRRIQLEYGDILKSETLNKVVGMNFKGWGRLSDKLLNDVMNINKETGEVYSLIENMWSSNDNLMELLSNHYSYSDEIMKINSDKMNDSQKVSYKDIEILPCSPSVKRQIWQSFEVVNELVKVAKKQPDKIFIEMARGGGEKNKRTLSRKKNLIELYSNIKEESASWIKELESLDDQRLQSDKLYLYYTQMGKCMYSNEKIDLGDLLTNNMAYDIDHIYPQSKIKDDSLDNRVLVKKVLNGEKLNVYPISFAWQQKCKGLWNALLKYALISKKKYERLVRTTEFSADELADFIDRQLVETRQTTKYVASILKTIMPKTEIVYVKAGNVSNFRHDMNLLKVRDINDLHHANDAYLNIVVGNVYNTKFGANARIFMKNKPEAYNMRRMFDYDVKRGEYYAWKQLGEDKTINKVVQTLTKNSPLVSRYTYEGKGGFFDQNIVKKKAGLFPIKASDERLLKTEIYGGYNKLATGYFIIIEHTKKSKTIRTIEKVPVLYINKLGNDTNALEKYCESIGYEKPRIICKKIKIKTLFKINGVKLRIANTTGTQIGFHLAEEAYWSDKQSLYIKKLIRVAEKISEKKIKKENYQITKYDSITVHENLNTFENLIYKLQNKPYKETTIFQSVALKLQNKKEFFSDIVINQQVVVLLEILKLFKNDATKSDLSLLQEGSAVGTIVLTQNLNPKDTIKIISQSPTGLYEKEIDVWSIK